MKITTSLSLLFAAAAVALLPAAAVAQDYPAESVDFSVEDIAVSEGAEVIDDKVVINREAKVRFVVGGFAPGAEVVLSIESDPVVLGTAIADANGEIDVEVDLPADFEPGDHTLKAAGDSVDGGVVTAALPVVVMEAVEFEAVVAAGTFEADEAVTTTSTDEGTDGGSLPMLPIVLVGALALGGGGFALMKLR